MHLQQAGLCTIRTAGKAFQDLRLLPCQHLLAKHFNIREQSEPAVRGFL